MEVPIWASGKKDDSGIDMSFTEEQIAFRDTVRKMVARHVAPIAAEIDETDRFPLELVKLFGEMGLMQLWVPERYGGPNGNLTLACLAREEISRVSPACASIAALNTMFIMPLLHFGSEEQRKKFLPIIAKGGVVTAIAISEPQAGSDVTAINTRAKKDGDSYVLNGRKQWIGNGHRAGIIGRFCLTLAASGRCGLPQCESGPVHGLGQVRFVYRPLPPGRGIGFTHFGS